MTLADRVLTALLLEGRWRCLDCAAVTGWDSPAAPGWRITAEGWEHLCPGAHLHLGHAPAERHGPQWVRHLGHVPEGTLRLVEGGAWIVTLRPESDRWMAFWPVATRRAPQVFLGLEAAVSVIERGLAPKQPALVAILRGQLAGAEERRQDLTFRVANLLGNPEARAHAEALYDDAAARVEQLRERLRALTLTPTTSTESTP